MIIPPQLGPRQLDEKEVGSRAAVHRGAGERNFDQEKWGAEGTFTDARMRGSLSERNFCTSTEARLEEV
jgi:hypothetical protein